MRILYGFLAALTVISFVVFGSLGVLDFVTLGYLTIFIIPYTIAIFIIPDLEIKETVGQRLADKSVKKAMARTNEKLKDLEEGSPLDFQGGKNFKFDRKRMTDKEGNEKEFIAFIGQTQDNTNIDILAYYLFEEDKLWFWDDNPSTELRRNPFKTFDPYGNKYQKRFGERDRRERRQEPRRQPPGMEAQQSRMRTEKVRNTSSDIAEEM